MDEGEGEVELKGRAEREGGAAVFVGSDGGIEVSAMVGVEIEGGDGVAVDAQGGGAGAQPDSGHRQAILEGMQGDEPFKASQCEPETLAGEAGAALAEHFAIGAARAGLLGAKERTGHGHVDGARVHGRLDELTAAVKVEREKVCGLGDVDVELEIGVLGLDVKGFEDAQGDGVVEGVLTFDELESELAAHGLGEGGYAFTRFGHGGEEVLQGVLDLGEVEIEGEMVVVDLEIRGVNALGAEEECEIEVALASCGDIESNLDAGQEVDTTLLQRAFFCGTDDGGLEEQGDVGGRVVLDVARNKDAFFEEIGELCGVFSQIKARPRRFADIIRGTSGFVRAQPCRHIHSEL